VVELCIDLLRYDFAVVGFVCFEEVLGSLCYVCH